VAKEVRLIAEWLPNPLRIGRGFQSMTRKAADRRSMRRLHRKMWCLSLSNEHFIWSLWRRSDGTNHSARQRVGVLALSCSLIAALTATVYAVDSVPVDWLAPNQKAADVLWALPISFVATAAAMAVRLCFTASRPRPPEPLDVECRVALNMIHSPQTLSEQNEVEAANQKESITTKRVGSVSTDSVSEFVDGDQTKTDKEPALSLSDIATEGQSMGSVWAAVCELTEGQSKEYRLSVLRQLLFRREYPLPHCARCCGWTLIAVPSVLALIATIYLSLSFDAEYVAESEADYLTEDCWDSVLLQRRENELSVEWLAATNQNHRESTADTVGGLALSVAVVAEMDRFGGNQSMSWLLSVILALAISNVLWQPLMCYVSSWLRLWMLSWNLEMTLSPANCFKLWRRTWCDWLCWPCCCAMHCFRRCCRCKGDRPTLSERELRGGSLCFDDRPFGLMAFVGGEEYVVGGVDGATNQKKEGFTVVELQPMEERKEEESAAVPTERAEETAAATTARLEVAGGRHAVKVSLDLSVGGVVNELHDDLEALDLGDYSDSEVEAVYDAHEVSPTSPSTRSPPK